MPPTGGYKPHLLGRLREPLLYTGAFPPNQEIFASDKRPIHVLNNHWFTQIGECHAKLKAFAAMPFRNEDDLPTAVLNILPNPVFVKGADTRYIWVNRAFEDLFNVRADSIFGYMDKDVFPDRNAAQGNGGDLRVLENGEVDEAHETIHRDGATPRVTITRKTRLKLKGRYYLIGVMHDITEVTEANEALKETTQKLEEQSEKLAEMAFTDPLTGVLNRRRLAELSEMVFGTHRNIGGALICDLDHFKRVNDTWGHDAGDKALVHFVNIAKAALREGDLIARAGGEEFACLIPGTQSSECLAIAERIRKSLQIAPMTYGNDRINLTVSIGVSHLDGRPFSLDQLLNEADRNLYEAKKAGRNRTVSLT